MTELNLIGYIAQEAARVAADYNFYWTIGNEKVGIKVTFKTSDLIWAKGIVFTNEDFSDVEDVNYFITYTLEKMAEELDDSQSLWFVKQHLGGNE